MTDENLPFFLTVSLVSPMWTEQLLNYILHAIYNYGKIRSMFLYSSIYFVNEMKLLR